jgi:beta-glucosidase/6-phospho-beta-glucosidase/beta-galactosidase
MSFAGKGASIWDTYVHTRPFIVDGSTGDIAADSYHLYKQDVKALKELGVRAILCKTISHVKCNRAHLYQNSLFDKVLSS